MQNTTKSDNDNIQYIYFPRKQQMQIEKLSADISDVAPNQYSQINSLLNLSMPGVMILHQQQQVGKICDLS